MFTKKTILAASVTAMLLGSFVAKNPYSNEQNLGNTATTSVVTAQIYNETEAAAGVAKLATKVWNKSCKEVARAAAYAVVDFFLGMEEATQVGNLLQQDIQAEQDMLMSNL
ncbi:MAG TPA: hypothetical protein PKC10_15630 [Cyclobacteriaceae bacterium]|nr:hypothetical protein [Cyclobacteriaceae bacterium]